MLARRTLQHLTIVLLVSMLFEWTVMRVFPAHGLVLGIEVNPRLVAWALPLIVFGVIILTFRYGRIFCSWCCPSHLYLEGDRWVTRRVGRWRHVARWAMALVASLFVVQACVTCFVPLSRQVASFQSEGIASRLFLVQVGLFLTVLLNFGLVRWRFCTHACPYGILMRLFKTDTTPVMSFDAASGRCINCRACDDVCPYELNVRKDSDGDLCTNCGLCAQTCESVLGKDNGVLAIKPGAPTPRARDGRESGTASQG